GAAWPGGSGTTARGRPARCIRCFVTVRGPRIGQDGRMAGSGGSAVLPVIDVGPLAGRAPAAMRAGVAGQIQAACRERGFFYVTGHDVPAGLVDQLADASAEFFALPQADKLEIVMERGGRACRGYFPPAAHPTSGPPDLTQSL